MIRHTLSNAHLRIRAFAAEQDGNLTVETIIILPIMFWAYLTMFTIFDAYRQVTVTQKANYTVADLISRQAVVDDAFMDGAMEVFDTLTRSSRPTALRVSSITYDAEDGLYSVQWSKGRGSKGALTSETVKNWHEKLPVLSDNSTVVVIETWSGFKPVFNIGLEEQGLSQFTFTRPRYTNCVTYKGTTESCS